MSEQLRQWKDQLDALWRAQPLDCGAALAIATEIARAASDPFLRAQATQALPALRTASGKRARDSCALAARRLGPVRDTLHQMTAPRFGRRGVPTYVNADDGYRKMLGLPPNGRLEPGEITRAYKSAAKALHPDRGGSEAAFVALGEARDALMARRG